MKVILSQDVKNVGRKYDVKDVADGYARNFLFSGHLAEPATATALAKLEKMKEISEKDDQELMKRLHEIAAHMNEVALQFELETDDHGTVFGSVNKEAIAKALREHSIVRNERVDVVLEHPIKKVGEYVVPVDLKKGITANLKIIVKKKE